MSTVRTVFPDAEILEDIERQIIIHTGLYSIGDPSIPLITWEETFKGLGKTNERSE